MESRMGSHFKANDIEVGTEVNNTERGKTVSNLCAKPVLVLNNAFEPLNICSAKRAMKLIVKGAAKAEKVHENQKFYSGKMWDENSGELVTVDFFLPSVIRLLEYRYIPIRTQIVTRKNIFNRDRNMCLYCGEVFPTGKLTMDHVIPRSRGGKNTWENLVTCCMPCNKRKGDKLLSELRDMKLRYTPKPLNSHTGRFILRNMGESDPTWREYLFFETYEQQEG
jgi:5-methylcytosine-specific restriction endonuclease McrA